MSFFKADSSFFLDAVASICQPTIQVVPLDDTEVFQYLDAHPDALLRYLSERVGLLESFSKTLTREDTLGEAAPEKEGLFASGEEVTDEHSVGDVQEVASEPAADAEQAADEWATGEADADDDDQDSDEMPPQAGPEECPSHAAMDATAAIADPIANNNEGDSDAKRSVPAFRAYPADPEAVEASKKEIPGRKWRLFEEEACIRHMLDIDREGQIKGEARFREALRRMQTLDGVSRQGPTVVKNFWNRYGRAISVFDERRNKNAPLATSQQGKNAKSSSSEQTETPSPDLDTRQEQSQSLQAEIDTADSPIPDDQQSHPLQSEIAKADSPVPAIPQPKPTKQNRQKKRKAVVVDTDDETDDDDDCVILEDNPAPVKPQSHKRRRIDDDEWQRDQATINAAAKGLRKKARTVYTF